MSNQPYQQVIHYHFEVKGEIIAITQVEEDCVHVEEVRKNGQEDTHMANVLILGDDGKCFWEFDGDENTFAIYHSEDLADGIREYVNTHGLPVAPSPEPKP